MTGREAGHDEAGVDPRKCYIVTIPMTHHHHHEGGAPHPSPTLSPSLMRLSAWRRLAIAGALIALIWAAFLWAIR
jgi:hypothetical protein